ncbi:MAG TPA: tetratricopeptide repeat protein [Polyangiaceae bacterium]|nr:tetratricopeptide repeat protein [Polyangiaceae bacterium]
MIGSSASMRPGRVRKGAGFGLVLLLLAASSSCARRVANPSESAIVLADKGRNAEAAQLLEAELQRHPEALRERRLLIRVYGALGNLGAAQRHSEQLGRQLGPASPIPFLELGHAHELCHRYDAALVLYDQAMRVAPNDPAGPRTGGLRAAEWGEVEEAEPRLSEAVRRAPRDARAWHALGVVRVKLGDLPGAEQAYRAGASADPRGLDNHIGLATLGLLRDDPRAVLAEYDAVVLLSPAFADAHLGRAWALVRLGRFDDATQAIDDAARLGASSRTVEKQRRWLASERTKSASTR